jgi:hemerythrin-like domain-containing protein
MLPIGVLMREHRLIEAMILLMRKESALVEDTGKVDSIPVDFIIGFLRTYVDRCHHGKEEEILFRELKKKRLSTEHNKILNDLIEEHAYARRTVGTLEAANKRYAQGADASKEIIQFLNDLIRLYSTHIGKEDKEFFIPSMEYFSKQELDNMLDDFLVFDKKVTNSAL